MKNTHWFVLFTIAVVNVSSVAMTGSNTMARDVEHVSKQARLNLAILIFDGVQIIDYTGPYETFGHAYDNDGPLFNIYTVGPKSGAITTTMEMSVNPKYNFANAPRPDVLVVPGGDIQRQLNDQNVIRWIQDSAKTATVTMSVCNGAFFLAKAGLLDGVEATTTFGLISRLREAAPKTKGVDNKRYVDNGAIVTAAGLSSGIDCSLHIIERFFGKGTAQMAALGMEYDWDPDSEFVRAALADKYMQFDYDVKFDRGGWQLLTREGTRDYWENRWAVTTSSSAAELLESVNKTIANDRRYGGPSGPKWNRLKTESNNGWGQSLWKFTDENGDDWTGIVRVEMANEQPNRFTLSVKVARDSANSRQPGA